MGARFRLHCRGLPGSPDLVFSGRKLCVFVHGCFWHRHPGCRFASMPATNTDFWAEKFDANVARDLRKTDELVQLGWRIEVIWECETRDLSRLTSRMKAILFSESPTSLRPRDVPESSSRSPRRASRVRHCQ